MAETDVTTIPLYLPHAEAAALARLAGRLGMEDCARLAAPCTVYDGIPEADVMWSGVLILRGALIAAGFSA